MKLQAALTWLDNQPTWNEAVCGATKSRPAAYKMRGGVVLTQEWDNQFAAYFSDRVQRMRGVAFALCGDWHLAEDLVQVSFVQLYRVWPRIDMASVDAYARRILVNAFLSDRRVRRRERLDAAVPETGVAGPDVAGRVSVRQALNRLPPRQRAVVVLRYLEDLSVAEVAASLDIDQGTVKSQCARGIQAMRAALGDIALTKE